MRTFIILVLLAVGSTPFAANAAPTVSLSSHMIREGETLTATGAGFTPGGNVLAHLVRPDGTEYPEMQFVADSRGGVSHLIRIILILNGTYELQMIDLASKATAVSRFMVVEGALPAAPVSQGDRTPPGFGGVWQGQVSRPRPPKAPEAQMVMVTLSGGEVGAVVGTLAYPSLSCGGELWLIGVSAGSVQLGEHITYGEERCSGHGIVIVGVGKDGALQFQRIDVEHPDAPPAVGTLPRRM